MDIAGFRFSPSLLPALAFAVLFPLMLGLGFWQLDRAEQKQELLEQQRQRLQSEAANLNQLSELVQADRFRPAVVTGEYDTRQQWLQDNRIYQGRGGYHVYSLLKIDDLQQRYVLVNRGWVTMGESRQFLPELPLPDGRVNLTGRLDYPASLGIVLGDAGLENVAPVVVLPTLDIAELARSLDIELLPFLLVLDEEQAGVLQRDWMQAQDIGPEKHVGYAVQWFGLAAALLIIFLGVNTTRIDRQLGKRNEHS